jgi:hypothetical protein
MLELRVAASLLRYRQDRDDPAAGKARAQLAAIVAALPEGRDTPDLREAVDLLGQR